jgi:hypothetical protein
MYAVSVGILWTATRPLAPAESKPSVWRFLGAAVLMTFFGNASHRFLNPLIGNGDVLVKLLAFVIAVKAVFNLAFWRSGLLALIFYAGVLAQYVLLFGEATS